MMLSYKKSNLLFLLIFLAISSLLGASDAASNKVLQKAYNLPTFIANSISLIYYILFFLILLTAHKTFFINRRINTALIPLSAGYLILTYWAFITHSDLIRYIALFGGITLLPVYLEKSIQKIKKEDIGPPIVFLLFLLILLATAYSFLNLPTHDRASGFHNNPNLMGMWLACGLTLVLYYRTTTHHSIVILFIVLTLCLSFLSGSRLSFLVNLVILAPYLWRKKIISSLLIVVASTFLYYSKFSLRVLELNTAVSDSGRSIIWNKAINCILQDPFVGYGMYAHQECINIGNVHNSYLRITTMVGIPLSIIFFTLLALSLFLLLKKRIDIHLKLFFLCIPILFFGEDYVATVASPFFPFFLFIVAVAIVDNSTFHKPH